MGLILHDMNNAFSDTHSQRTNVLILVYTFCKVGKTQMSLDILHKLTGARWPY